MVEFLLHEAGLVLSHKAYNWAAEVGGLAVIRWLALEAGMSATGCNLSSVVEQWPRSTQDSSRALLEAVRLVVRAGWCCDTDRYAADYAIGEAVRRGDLPLVQYLHRQLQPKEEVQVGRFKSAAVSGGCEALLEWMAGQPGWCTKVGSPYGNAARNEDKGTLATLRRLGVPWDWDGLLVQAVERAYELPVLRWLVEQGAPFGAGNLQRAVQSRGLDGEKAAELLSWAADVCSAAASVAQR